MSGLPSSSAGFACAADRVFDGTRTWIDHAVLVQNGVVSGLCPSNELDPAIPVRTYPGCTILPGLIDTHIHFMSRQGTQYLAWGVTTVRDTGNELDWILARRSEWPGKPWPRILCVGPLLDGPHPFHKFVSRACPDLPSAVTAVRETAQAGVDGIKLYVGLPPDWLAPMTREAHAAGLKVSRHCSGAGVLQAGRAGVDEFFHLDGILADLWPDHPPGWLNLWGLPDLARTADRQQHLADAIRELGLTATPTLAYWDSQGQPVNTPNPAQADQWRKALEAAQRFVGILLRHGVPILAGTDVPCGAVPPGLSLWRELQLLVGAGLTPEQAIQAATTEAANFLGHPEWGRLASGTAADLIVVRGNPLERIPESPELPLVVRQGQLYSPQDLLSATGQELPSNDDPWARQFSLAAGAI